MQKQQTYSRCKLDVKITYPGFLSHQMVCLCKTMGYPSDLEKAFLLKKVNFYKFKEYVEQVLKVPSFQVWYNDNANTETFKVALAAFINYSEKRLFIYSTAARVDAALNQAILQTSITNTHLKAYLNN